MMQDALTIGESPVVIAIALDGNVVLSKKYLDKETAVAMLTSVLERVKGS